MLSDEQRRDFWLAMREWNDSPPFKFDQFAASNEILYVAVERIASDAARAARAEADRRLGLLQMVVAYDNANQSDLPLALLDGIRAEVGGPR